jgi:hypothetical protein
VKLRPGTNALPLIAACLSAVVVAVRANLFFLRPSPALLHGFDEAYAVALGRRMLEGSFLPYVDGVSHRGPLYYASVAIAVRIFGNGTWLPVRVLGLLAIVTTIGLGVWAAWAARRSVAGAVMALVYTGVLCVAMPVDDGLAYNSEHPLSVFAMASLGCLVFALRPEATVRRVVWAALSGAALSASGLCKQTGFVLVVPFGLWIACSVSALPELSARERKAIPIAFALGVLVPLLALILRYAAAGELSTLYYYLVTYNTQVYRPASLGYKPLQDSIHGLLSHYYVFLALSPLLFWIILAPLAKVGHWRDWPRAYAEHGFVITVALATLITPFAANAARRNFDHYYVQVAPFAGLVLGFVVEQLLREVSGGRRLLLARCAALLPLIAVVEIGWLKRVESFSTDWVFPFRFRSHDSPVCAFLEKHTRPDESLFIYGFDPAHYTACNRRPASRYVYTTFVSGYVPRIDDDQANDPARVVPGSHRILEAELLAAPPAAILDVPMTLGLRTLWSDDFLRKLVESEYCELYDLKKQGMRAWVRRGRPACPAR